MSSNNLRAALKERVRMLPALPGIYQFLNKDGVVIYIGKAKNLKSRVSQYFNSEDGLSIKTRVMVSRIYDFEHTIVESEEDALLLENNLIKQYLPKYNVMLKDGKTYPWICIRNEPFPRVYITRRVIKDGSRYFGPYSSAMHAHNLIELVSSLYYLRDCNLNLSSEAISQKRYRPCLKYHIGKCKAPCDKRFTSEEYLKQIERIESLLKGEVSALIREFREKMQVASSELKFESAQLYKDKIELISNHSNRSLVVSQSITNVDVFSLIFTGNIAFGNYIRVVNGYIIPLTTRI